MTFGLHDTDITCTTLCLSLDVATVTLFRDLDTHYIHYLSLIFLVPISDPVTLSNTLFAFALINKINQAGVLGGDCSRVNPGRCAWKGDPLWVWMPHVILLFMHAPVITCYMIPEYSELFLPAIRIH